MSGITFSYCCVSRNIAIEGDPIITGKRLLTREEALDLQQRLSDALEEMQAASKHVDTLYGWPAHREAIFKRMGGMRASLLEKGWAEQAEWPDRVLYQRGKYLIYLDGPALDQRCSFRYRMPDGTEAEIAYDADQNLHICNMPVRLHPENSHPLWCVFAVLPKSRHAWMKLPHTARTDSGAWKYPSLLDFVLSDTWSDTL
jgi:hypothetical protein